MREDKREGGTSHGCDTKSSDSKDLSQVPGEWQSPLWDCTNPCVPSWEGGGAEKSPWLQVTLPEDWRRLRLSSVPRVESLCIQDIMAIGSQHETLWKPEKGLNREGAQLRGADTGPEPRPRSSTAVLDTAAALTSSPNCHPGGARAL